MPISPQGVPEEEDRRHDSGTKCWCADIDGAEAHDDDHDHDQTGDTRSLGRQQHARNGNQDSEGEATHRQVMSQARPSIWNGHLLKTAVSHAKDDRPDQCPVPDASVEGEG